MSIKTDLVLQSITQSIISALEEAQDQKLNWNISWSKLGLTDIPSNHDTALHYSGINILLLCKAKLDQGFLTSRFVTYKQAQKLGYQVKKGAKGTNIIKYGTFIPKDNNVSGIPSDIEMQAIGYLQVYTVFNLCQLDGVDLSPYLQKPEFMVEEIASQACMRAKYIKDHCGAKLHLGHDNAFYRPFDDSIYIPGITQFNDPEDFYAVLFHELTHWTGRDDRLDRHKKSQSSKLSAYAYEELVAELGAAFMCADTGILSDHSRQSHAAYIQGWLSALKNDHTFILKAASHASKAFFYIKDQVKHNADVNTDLLQNKAA